MIDINNELIPILGNNDPSYQNASGKTVAIKLVLKGIIPSKEW